jgi:PKD repeat protein
VARGCGKGAAMRIAQAVCAALLCASCVKRVAPKAGGDRTVGSGIPQRFGEAQDLPEGTSIAWDFGDGAPPAQGAAVTHAFPRAGNFTVQETVRDKAGQVQTATARVTVLRRSVPRAVPADVRGAFIAEQPWRRTKAAREASRRVGLADLFEETVSTVNDAVGFDTTDATAASENGIDPDEGIALYTVPQDDEAVVLCIGISDMPKAEAALRKLLSAGAQPFTLTDTQLPGGQRAVVGTRTGGVQRIGWVERFGYLYLRTRGRSDPLVALATAAALPEDGGLAKDPGYLSAMKQVGTGDAVFYSSGPREGAPEEAHKSFLTGQLGASAFAVSLAPDGLALRIFAQLRNVTGQGLEEMLTPLKAPPDLAAQLPGGAAAYLKLSGTPVKVWRELIRAMGTDGAVLHDRVRDYLGAEPEEAFLPHFSGNAGLGIYLDAPSLLEAFLGEQVSSLDKSTFIAVAEVAAGHDDELRRVLDKMGHGVSGVPVRGARFWRVSDILQVAQKQGFFYAALGGGAQHAEPAPPAVDRPVPPAKKGARSRTPPLPKALPPPTPQPQPQAQEPSPAQLGPLAALLLPEVGAHTLGDELTQASLRGFDSPKVQLAWIDIRGVLRSLTRAADDQGGMVSAGVRLLGGRVRGLRDALFEARPSPDGLAATLTLRYADRASRAAERGGSAE